jgi:hypothetical protein
VDLCSRRVDRFEWRTASDERRLKLLFWRMQIARANALGCQTKSEENETPQASKSKVAHAG